MNYYNEFDPHAAAWLQGLIDENLIPPGHVDTRSITEISPSDLHGYTQCHFFAGIGGWPLALQLAGVPATRPLWSGSCPCQPFSVAGEGKGIEDERHLWPVFFELIRACNPPLVFGEQVAGAAVLGSSAKPSQRSAGKAVQPVWLDGVFADLESAGYACGSAVMAACSVSAPHIRQRCWWGAVRLADTEDPNGWRELESERARSGRNGLAGSRELERMADSFQSRLEGHPGNVHDGNEPGRIGADEAGSVAQGGESCGVGDSNSQSTRRHTGGTHAAEAEHGAGKGDDHGFVDAGDGLSGGHAHGSGECGGVALSNIVDGHGAGFNPGDDGGQLGGSEQLQGESDFRRLAHTNGRDASAEREQCSGEQRFFPEGGSGCGMGDTSEQRLDGERLLLRTEEAGRDEAGILEASRGSEVGFWDASHWHPCRDGKYRRVPVESGLFPLVDGLSYRVARRRTVRPALLRGAGNAIVPEVAAEFVKAFLEIA